MNDKMGKLGSGYVWLFALGAVLVSIAAAYATAGLGPKVSSAAYFGVFLASGFAATVFTKAKALLSLTAFLGASLISAATYYLIAMQAVGVFVAVITFVVSAAGGVSGTLAGLRAQAARGGLRV